MAKITKIRASLTLGEIISVEIPIGTDMQNCLKADASAKISNGDTVKAGSVMILGSGVVGFTDRDITTGAANKLSTSYGQLIVYCKKVILPKSTAATVGVFAAGGKVYWDNTAAVEAAHSTKDGSGTGGTAGTLTPVGYALAAAAQADTEVTVCWDGRIYSETAKDITTIKTT